MRSRKRFLLLLPPLLFAGLWVATVWLGKPQVEREMFEREVYVDYVRGVPYRREDYRRIAEQEPWKEWAPPFYRMETSSPFPLVVVGECYTHWDPFAANGMRRVYLWFFGVMVPFERVHQSRR